MSMQPTKFKTLATALLSAFILTACNSSSSDSNDSANEAENVSAQSTATATSTDTSTDTSNMNSAMDKAATTQGEENKMDIFEIRGTVEYKDIEGGFFAIIGEKGEKYTPMGLRKEHKVDGASITIKASLVTDMMTTTQFGELVKIHEVMTFEKPEGSVGDSEAL